MCMCMCVYVYVYVRACVRACMRVSVCVYVSVSEVTRFRSAVTAGPRGESKSTIRYFAARDEETTRAVQPPPPHSANGGFHNPKPLRGSRDARVSRIEG